MLRCTVVVDIQSKLTSLANIELLEVVSGEGIYL